MGVDTVMFDLESQRGQDLRLVMWASFTASQCLSACLKLRQRVACRFVTVKLIDIDNLMQDMGDDHPSPNVDVESILLKGAVIPS